MAEKELEEQLAEAGKRLLKPPSATDELLSLLEQVENCLVRVEQSPSKTMLAALDPAKEALTANEFLKHSDMDVKVAVASCISEITRITAPDAPYNDDLMKEIFRVIVASFEDLFDTSSQSHLKRVSILETVAKVRSCVVMLDLECDDLVLEMFQHFLKANRETLPENVFSSMETIMTLVLEESEDVSSDLLSCLLTSVRKEKQNDSPVAYKLGEKVISICASKLRPYLVQEVKSKGLTVDNYTKVVASICQEASDGVDCNDLNTTDQQVADESKLSERTDSDEPPQGAERMESQDGDIDHVAKTPTSPLSNGTVQTGKEPNSPKRKPEHFRLSNQTKDSHGAEPDQTSKSKRGRKAKPMDPLVEVSENSRVASEHQSAEAPVRKEGTGKETDNSFLSEGLAVKGSAPSDSEKKGELSSPVQSHHEAANAGAQSPNQALPDSAGRPKRGRPPGKKKAPIVNTEADHPATLSESKVSVSGDLEEQSPEAADIKSKESESTRDLEIRTMKDQTKNMSLVDANDDETLRSTDKSSKKELSVEKQEDKIKRRKGTSSSEKVTPRGSNKKKIGSSEKSAKNASIDDQIQLQETPKVKPKRKRSMATEEGSEPVLDEKIVGSKVEVWWPDDDEFYRGTVASYDPIEKKHKVLYDDGDEETLFLKEEKFHLVMSDEAADLSNRDVSSERRLKKKMKNSPESLSKPAKMDIVSKRGSSSTGKLKADGARSSGRRTKGGDTTKSSSKMKDSSPKDSKMKSKDDTAISKSKEEGPKSGSKSKDDSLKSGSKSKDEGTPRTGLKSKTETPKTGGKSNTNGSSSVKAKTGHLKVLRSEDAKGKSSSVDAQESGQSGKKRRRKVQS
ncbi:sister chromatid cohesion protein PDS5 homolog C-like isoform X2 [Aristolochia californica]|uniref:sister chromatid cohesion protein PDS5 homolog C-like isoform X2 n=1 Tax=Aristolochia californica TaxID=171875 RepID=UPI0035D90818